MRSAALLAGVVALSGCLQSLPGLLEDDPPPPVDSSVALAEMHAWVAATTTRDAQMGMHWRERDRERADEGHFYVPSERQPLWTVAPPYLTRLDTVEGEADWAALYDVLDPRMNDLVHPDYWDLLFESIHGEFFPQDYRGPIDGLAPRWVGRWQVEWDSEAEDRWDLELRDGTQWRMLSTGAGGTSCHDLADETLLLNSTAALAVAAAEPGFQQTQRDHPEGEAWLTLLVQDAPQVELDREGIRYGCPEAASLTWRVRWMDVDAMLREGSAPYADVVLDARSGDVVRAYGATMRPPGSYAWTVLLSAFEPTVATPATSSWSFDVPQAQVRLRVEVEPATPAAGAVVGSSGSYILRDPEGHEIPLTEFVWWNADAPHPLPGRWQLERVLEPGVDSSHALRKVTAGVLG